MDEKALVQENTALEHQIADLKTKVILLEGEGAVLRARLAHHAVPSSPEPPLGDDSV